MTITRTMMCLSPHTDHTRQMMYLQESKDIITKTEVLGGKTSHHITVTEIKMNKAKGPPGHHGQEGLVRLWDFFLGKLSLNPQELTARNFSLDESSKNCMYFPLLELHG